jgi:hypothetical protein
MRQVSVTETSANLYQTTRCNISKYYDLHRDYHKNLKHRNLIDLIYLFMVYENCEQPQNIQR